MRNMVVRAFVTMLDADPAIWRRIEIPADFTLKNLHDIIQAAMGWYDYHLHHFEIGGSLYGEPAPDDYDREILNERKIKLGMLGGDGERAFDYVYDYGDNWRCTIVLEALLPSAPGATYPRLIDGARRGPPEDVGGPWGYAEFLDAIADPEHERHAELTEWSGGNFNPDHFDPDEINRALRQLSPRKGASSKKTKPAIQ
jgi:Plasmid pRiA4b ORF-3-like protein